MALTKPAQCGLYQRERDRQHPKPGVDQKKHTDIDGRPRCVEKRKNPLPGQELSNLQEVTQRAGRMRPGFIQVRLKACVEDARAQHVFQANTDANQQS